MKNLAQRLLFILFIALCSSVAFRASAQIVVIPDANFKNALVHTLCLDINGDNIGDADADSNNDGEIQVSEALAVVRLDVQGQNIQSLAGSESFSNLIRLSLLVHYRYNLNP